MAVRRAAAIAARAWRGVVTTCSAATVEYGVEMALTVEGKVVMALKAECV